MGGLEVGGLPEGKWEKLRQIRCVFIPKLVCELTIVDSVDAPICFSFVLLFATRRILNLKLPMFQFVAVARAEGLLDLHNANLKHEARKETKEDVIEVPFVTW